VDVCLAGGLHDDPLCKSRLIDWLTAEVARRGSEPSFVGVEMDEGIQYLLRTKRNSFRNLAGGLWGDGAAPAVVTSLASAMAWEVDAYRKVLPGVEPTYLDPPDRATSQGVDGLLAFGSCLVKLQGFSGNRNDVDEVVAWLSKAAVTRATTDGTRRFAAIRDDQRKREKAWMYNLRFQLEKSGWGLAIVGALHASRYDHDTFRQLLISAGHMPIPHYLTWTPPAAIQ